MKMDTFKAVLCMMNHLFDFTAKASRETAIFFAEWDNAKDRQCQRENAAGPCLTHFVIPLRT
jgi:hypothetical protein